MQARSKAEAIALGLNTYYTGKPCKHGHLAHRYTSGAKCSECVKARVAAWKKDNPDANRLSYQRNREKRIAKSKEWREANPEKHKAAKEAWRKRNQALINERARKSRPSRAQAVPLKHEHRIIARATARDLELPYYYTGKACRRGHFSERFTGTAICVECNREYAARVRLEQPERQKGYRHAANEAAKSRRKSDPLFKSAAVMREMVRRVIRLAKSKKKASSFDLLGYTPDEFKAHIEGLFLDGMTWSNHGAWHVDHKIPVSVMIKRGITDPAMVNALSNLQPLWAEDNHRKSAKIAQ